MNLHHVGFWVDDIDEMIDFLVGVMEGQLLSRRRFDSGDGERAFVKVGEGQVIEILTQAVMQPRPAMTPHMANGAGAVVGIPHLCFQVTDLWSWEERLTSLGYAIHHKMPDHGGYRRFEFGSVRAMFFTGPGGIDFELFEFEKE
ncbi:MAG: VOC family protein [Byssovorax sp.]